VPQKELRVLNDPEEPATSSTTPPASPPTPPPATDVAKALNRSILRLFGSFLSDDGKKVDYASIPASPLFASFVEDVQVLGRVKVDSLLETERAALFINVYNVLEIHSTVVAVQTLGEEARGTFAWKRFKNRCCYRIGGLLFTQSGIEHGVLRGNKRPPYVLTRIYWPREPRAQLGCVLDPRIHFILNCGARSCPPLRVVDADSLDRALHLATVNFVNDPANVSLNSDTGTLSVSAIFKWYCADFGVPALDFSYKAVVSFILKHLREDSPSEATFRKALSDLVASGSLSLTFMPYDWSSNAAAEDDESPA
jgi:hypothetical protein